MLLLIVFPIQIEAGDDGSIDPDTVPNAIAGFLVVCGILLAQKGEQTERDFKELMLVLLYLAIIAASLLPYPFWISYRFLPGVGNR